MKHGTLWLLLKATCRRSDFGSASAGHLVPGRRMIARLALFEAMIVIQAIDLKTRYRSLAEEMPSQIEVSSLNFNLVAL
jgi:hypothetical protein